MHFYLLGAIQISLLLIIILFLSYERQIKVNYNEPVIDLSKREKGMIHALVFMQIWATEMLRDD